MRFVYRAYIVNKEETSAVAGTAVAGSARKIAQKRMADKQGNRPPVGSARTADPQNGGGQRDVGSGSAARPTTTADKNIGLHNTERGNAQTPGQEDRRNVGVENKSVDGIKRQTPEPVYTPNKSQPVFRQRPANDNADTTKHAA